jgi:hypothetical protein
MQLGGIVGGYFLSGQGLDFEYFIIIIIIYFFKLPDFYDKFQ